MERSEGSSDVSAQQTQSQGGDNGTTSCGPSGESVRRECEKINAQLAVNRLPPEILVDIFQLVQWMLGWKSYGCGTTPAWIPFTWVCRHWRSVAVAAPVLWTSIQEPGRLDSLVWVPTFLERAAGALLDLNLSLKGDNAECAETLKLLLPHASTFRRLYFWWSEGPDSLGVVLAPFLTRMTALEELSLLDFSSSEDDFSLNPIHDHFPRLRKLELNSVRISWNSSIFTSLHTLSIRYAKDRPTSTELFALLQACPDLVKLVLQDCFPKDEAGPAVVATLASLRCIELFGTPEEILMFTNHVIVTPRCDIRIQYKFTTSDGRAPGREDPFLALVPRSSMFGALLPVCTSFSITEDEGIVDMSLGTGTDTSILCGTSETCEEDPVLSHTTWKELLECLSRSPLTHFTVRYDALHTITPEMWQLLLSRIPTLEKISLGPYWRLSASAMVAIGNLLTALRNDSEAIGSGAGSTKLSSLELTTISLDNPMIDALIALAGLRLSRGAPLQELAFRGCYCSPEVDIAVLKTRLQQVVPKITVQYATSCPCCGGYEHFDEFQGTQSSSSEAEQPRDYDEP